MKTNSNSYTIIYSVVLVVIVALLLAVVFQALKPQQDINVALDKQKQILYSLNIRDLDDASAAAKYKEVVVADRIIDENGTIVEPGTQGGTSAGFKLNSADYKSGRLALFVCNVDGQTKYVIPVYGMGLWGPINAFVALNEDKATVYGAYFNHEGETAGLGAEIKDNLKWQQQFQGKKLFKEGNNTDIALAAVKKIDDPATQVDMVTGATLTSNGVTDMFKEGFGKYMKFLNEK
ncbi:NADH:ubiquinone oxidoreductase, Na(+)-translocating, C subunit [Hallella bergensis DSM 17361]|uniref:Na(+)-translocating NADH-quinone reductase subunit C n=1 Tax=Hallella bergensis DSM 17361 TaxID=585502 RepID=D1PYS9_9BACT|nr:NADH:ubiquinone reductase (Na(+)-transporting) subunit C [Hallella bergensis]EFA43436.1 NADH:ubiquinone oxidoreductase, Na(+)-translocating, C subunit [Hallella bergensis DSM 17361]